MKTSSHNRCPATTVCLVAILTLAVCVGCPNPANNQIQDEQNGESRTSHVEPRLQFDGSTAVDKILAIDQLTPRTLKIEIGQPNWTASDSEGCEAFYYYSQDGVAIVTFRDGAVIMVEALGDQGKLIKRVRLDQADQEQDASDEPTN